MADHPIMFSGPMVRALLAGTKTQTRRAVRSARVFATPESKPFSLNGEDLARALQNASGFRRLDGNGWFWEADAYKWQAPADRTGWMAHIGFAPGDRLYVREAWHAARSLNGTPPRDIPRDADIEHAATARSYAEIGLKGKLRPAMFMPRWASRLTLTVTDVRIERLQDCSETDAWAEGCEKGEPDDAGGFFPAEEPNPSGVGCWGWDNARDWYADLWDHINGPGSWDANPWVAAYTFAVEHGNIDQLAPQP